MLQPLLVFSLLSLLVAACGVGKSSSQNNRQQAAQVQQTTLRTGAQQDHLYVEWLKGKKVGLVLNQTAIYDSKTHLVDFLRQQNINITRIFVPEHGFRGTADAGEHVKNGIDPQTKIPLMSLYGQDKKPKPEYIKDLDILLFDIQDVGARFYTYISTLHYLMEACAEHNKPLIVLDRPNPNGHYVDGPIRQQGFSSFVGVHPIPIVHGLTVAELAQMINGEKWLRNGLQCELKLIHCKNYTHQTPYILPVRPSPNLKDSAAIWLYPSLCLFEGTPLSVGRGTPLSFRIFGHPNLPQNQFSFVPKADEGNKKPIFENQICYGTDLSHLTAPLQKLDISYLLKAYEQYPEKAQFFTPFFDKLAGDSTLRICIQKGMTEAEIRQTWQKDLNRYRVMRKKYLLYPEN
ncbi:MAG: DUF1343 domain-containing protein [Cytophagales bacterium]|nr:MAG: DUF1343 domain-containing protein [Cytophagales bacterium]TAF60674.1 MAG: DUF1343 domain-containing protein [Cytophagales bacterium]